MLSIYLASVQARKHILALRHPASDYDLTSAADRRLFNDLQLCRLEYGDEGFRTWLVAKYRFAQDCETVFCRFFDMESEDIQEEVWEGFPDYVVEEV